MCMIACVADAMVDLHIAGIDREHFRDPLLAKPKDLSDDDEPRLTQTSGYAYQGLLNIDDNETKWQAFRRHSWALIQASASLAGAVATLGPSKIVDAIPSTFQILELFVGIVNSGKELLLLSEKVNEAFTEVVRSGAKRNTWYLALRYTSMLIEAKAFKNLTDLLGKKPCDNQEAFFCGLYAQLERSWVTGDD